MTEIKEKNRKLQETDMTKCLLGQLIQTFLWSFAWQCDFTCLASDGLKLYIFTL